MKMVCIRAANVHDYRFPITVGRIYDASSNTDSYDTAKFINITNDKGIPSGFPLDWFKPLDEVRQEKLSILGI